MDYSNYTFIWEKSGDVIKETIYPNVKSSNVREYIATHSKQLSTGITLISQNKCVHMCICIQSFIYNY